MFLTFSVSFKYNEKKTETATKVNCVHNESTIVYFHKVCKLETRSLTFKFKCKVKDTAMISRITRPAIKHLKVISKTFKPEYIV